MMDSDFIHLILYYIVRMRFPEVLLRQLQFNFIFVWLFKSHGVLLEQLQCINEWLIISKSEVFIS